MGGPSSSLGDDRASSCGINVPGAVVAAAAGVGPDISVPCAGSIEIGPTASSFMLRPTCGSMGTVERGRVSMWHLGYGVGTSLVRLGCLPACLDEQMMIPIARPRWRVTRTWSDGPLLWLTSLSNSGEA